MAIWRGIAYIKKDGDIMYDYMYQYRGNVERIMENLGSISAWQYVEKLYHNGLIHIVEHNGLLEYIRKLKKRKVIYNGKETSL